MDMSRRFLVGAMALAPIAISAPAVAMASVSEFPAALADYQHWRELYVNHISGELLSSDPGYEEAWADSNRVAEHSKRALRRMLLTPSRNASDLAVKIDAVTEEYRYFEFPDDLMEIISADAKRLAV